MTNLEMNNTKKTRLDYLDWFRAYACIAVITIHVTASAIGSYVPKSLPQIAVTLLNGLMLFAVPSFIAISGYTFMAVYEKKSIGFLEFLKKRLSMIVLPYILWNLLYYFYGLKIGGGSFSLQTMLYDLVTGKASYHLYFMPLIFQFYILFLPLKKVVDRLSWKFLLPLTLLFHWGYTTYIKAHIFLSDRVFLSYLLFYLIGMMLGKHHAIILTLFKKYWWLLGFGYLITEGFYLSDRLHYFVYQANPALRMPYAWELSSIFSILLLLLLSELAAKQFSQSKVHHAVSSISAVSFDIYLAHPLVLSLLSLNYARFGIQSYTIQLILSWTLCLLIPYGVFTSLKHLKKR